MTLYQQGARFWIDGARKRDDYAPTNVHLDLLAGGDLLRRPGCSIEVALSERFVARLEPGQEFVEELFALDRSAGHLAQAGHAGFQVGRELGCGPVDVDAYAHDGPTDTVSLGSGLAQDSGNLLQPTIGVRGNDVVGPFETERVVSEAGRGFGGVEHRQTHRCGEPPALAEGQVAGPEADRHQKRGTWRRGPRPALSPTAGRLFVGDCDRNFWLARLEPFPNDSLGRVDASEALDLRSERPTCHELAIAAELSAGRRLGLLELERGVQRARSLLEIRLGDDAGDPDVAHRDHLDVDAVVSQRAEHPCRVARRRLDSGANDRDLRNAGIGRDAL